MDDDLSNDFFPLMNNQDMPFIASPYYSGTNTPIEGGGGAAYRRLINQEFLFDSSLPRPNFFPDGSFDENAIYFRSTPTSPNRRNSIINNGPAPTPISGLQNNLALPRHSNDIYSAPVSPRLRQQQEQAQNQYLNGYYINNINTPSSASNPFHLQPNNSLSNYQDILFSSLPNQPNGTGLPIGIHTSLIPSFSLQMMPQISQTSSNFSIPEQPSSLTTNHLSNLTIPPTPIKPIVKNEEEFAKPKSVPKGRPFKNRDSDEAISQTVSARNVIPDNIEKFYKQPTPSLPEKDYDYEILVMGIPPTGVRSRVETQIKLCLKIVCKTGEIGPLPWSHLRLPPYYVAGDKDRRKGLKLISNILPPENKIINLRASIVCSSEPKTKVLVCMGCVQRERKRQIKKISKNNSTPSTTPAATRESSPKIKQPGEADTVDPVDLEQKKIMILNTTSMVDISSGDVILPTRITCYCRHHREPKGFIIKFSLFDHNMKPIAVGSSPPIMITDDHKTKPKNSPDEPMKKPKLSKRGSKGKGSLATIPEISPSNSSHFDISDPFNVKIKSNSPISRALPLDMTRSFALNAQNSNSLISLPQNSNLKEIRPLNKPKISHIVPSQAPLHGGVEVAILGHNFRENMVVYFGNSPVLACKVWSSESALCLVPPCKQSGQIEVTIHLPTHPLSDRPADPYLNFIYHDGTDRALLELALQVVGLRKTGVVEEARQVAMRIVQDQQQQPLIAGFPPIAPAKTSEAPAPPTTPTRDL